MQSSTVAWEKRGSLWEGASLVAGTAIGGGMLAIPLYTFQTGFWNACLASLVAWACLTATGLAFCRVLAVSPDQQSFLALSHRWMGPRWSPFVSLLFMGLIWLLLVAYCAGGGALLAWEGASNATTSMLFALPLVAILGRGRQATARWNGWMFSALIGVGVGFAVLAAPEWRLEALMQPAPTHGPSWWLALPVLFATFGFHNVLPTVRMELGPNPRRLSAALLLGTTVALILVVGWQALVFGCCSTTELAQIAQSGGPVTCAVAAKTPWTSLFYGASILFAYLAVATSFLGVAQAGSEVLSQGSSRTWRYAMLSTFVGTAWIAALIMPGVFGQALSLAGGFGVSFLNGVLPVAMLLQASRKGALRLHGAEQILLWILMALCLIPMVLELG